MQKVKVNMCLSAFVNKDAFRNGGQGAYVKPENDRQNNKYNI